MLHSFRRLQWRMTFSYILVTIPAIVLLQVCFLVLVFGAFYAFINSQAVAEDQAGALAVIAPQAAAYLRSPTPDQDGLTQWLQGTMCVGAYEPTMFPKDMQPESHAPACRSPMCSIPEADRCLRPR
jgi:hypothetical protein